MTVTLLRPNADIAGDMTLTGSATYFGALDDAVTQPTAPGTGTDYCSHGTAGRFAHVGCQTFTKGLDVVSQVTLWIYLETGKKRGCLFRINSTAGTLQEGSVGADTAAGWQSITYTGTLEQADIDALAIYAEVTATAPGGGAGTVAVYAAYLEVTHAAPGQNPMRMVI